MNLLRHHLRCRLGTSRLVMYIQNAGAAAARSILLHHHASLPRERLVLSCYMAASRAARYERSTHHARTQQRPPNTIHSFSPTPPRIISSREADWPPLARSRALLGLFKDRERRRRRSPRWRLALRWSTGAKKKERKKKMALFVPRRGREGEGEGGQFCVLPCSKSNLSSRPSGQSGRVKRRGAPGVRFFPRIEKRSGEGENEQNLSVEWTDGQFSSVGVCS